MAHVSNVTPFGNGVQGLENSRVGKWWHTWLNSPRLSSLILCKELSSPEKTSAWERNNLFPILCTRPVLTSTGSPGNGRRQVGEPGFQEDVFTAAPWPCRCLSSAHIIKLPCWPLATEPWPTLPIFWHKWCSLVVAGICSLRCGHTQPEQWASHEEWYEWYSLWWDTTHLLHANLGPASTDWVHIIHRSFFCGKQEVRALDGTDVKGRICIFTSLPGILASCAGLAETFKSAMGEQLLLLVIQTPRCCQDGPIALCGHISLLFFLSPFSYTSSLKQTTRNWTLRRQKLNLGNPTAWASNVGFSGRNWVKNCLGLQIKHII